MFLNVLKFGSRLDWITPTIALLNDLRNGSKVIFFVPFGIGWSAVDVKKMLESKGVYVWGLWVAGDEIKFRVRETQARYAAYWLERNRIPFDSSMKEDLKGQGQPSPNDKTGSGGTKGGSGKKTGMFDGVLDGIDGLVDSL